MKDHSYEYYVDIVTKRYFHGVDNNDVDMIMACFHEDAVLKEMTSDTTHDGHGAIKKMFDGLLGTYRRIWHGNFVHTVDQQEQTICSQFSVEVTDEAGDLNRYENCNLFLLKDGKFAQVFVYMSGENLLT